MVKDNGTSLRGDINVMALPIYNRQPKESFLGTVAKIALPVAGIAAAIPTLGASLPAAGAGLAIAGKVGAGLGAAGGALSLAQQASGQRSTPGQLPLGGDAVSRRLQAQQESPLATLRQSIMALPQADEEVRKTYAAPLMQAYVSGLKSRGGGGGYGTA